MFIHDSEVGSRQEMIRIDIFLFYFFPQNSYGKRKQNREVFERSAKKQSHQELDWRKFEVTKFPNSQLHQVCFSITGLTYSYMCTWLQISQLKRRKVVCNS